ncbi:VanZ like family protein [Flavobacterium xinjiangense]|uniref:VanZ like family protein n=1 Tax=Flavobacterium xinjiangense TaxID=178356 RepID=A0A1M7E5P8_9FLAO|nr:VanZ like family protein [Flavobacterium xinjiangense]
MKLIHCFRVNHTKNLLVPKLLYFWIALSWTGVIAYFCLTPSSNLPSVSILYLDKFVHASFHFVFTVFWFLFFKKQLGSNLLKPLCISFVFSVFFGIGIEILQGCCTTTRRADFIDVLANMAGAILAVCIVLIFNKYRSVDKI